MLSGSETLALVIRSGVAKLQKTHLEKFLLGFLAGAFIGLGFFADLKVTAVFPKEFAGLASFLGAAVFPMGLIAVVIVGAELLTGNFMTVTVSLLDRKVKVGPTIINFIEIAIYNVIGAVATAFLLTHLTGMVNTTPDNLAYHTKLLAMAASKVAASPSVAFFSAIGCNWLVGLSIWQYIAGKDTMGKIIGAWFPIMVFVAIGFQHSVANSFLIPAAIFAGAPITWGQFFANFGIVALGNLVGAALFVSVFHYYGFRKGLPKEE
ncbi:MAG: formate/nitrite transporter family protein [Streptococcaceae bacterium]|jgi:formate/nitrite transporter|nr:formate/nitrite transporter family protein [Streptococcaceae bacterium]